jgi:hypothetical protein
VQYWEAQGVIDPTAATARQILKVLGLPNPRCLARESGVLHSAKMSPHVASRPSVNYVCGATTRRGTACQNPPEPGRTRCKFHGGKSTGPRSAEGRSRIAEAQRARWAAWRAKAE